MKACWSLHKYVQAESARRLMLIEQIKHGQIEDSLSLL